MEGGNLAFAVTQNAADQDAMARYAGQPITCHHCGAQRQRNDSFVLRDGAASAYRQVGFSCLKDYTGIDPVAVLFLAHMYQVASLAEADLDGLAAAGCSNAVATLTFLANVVFLSRHLGFVSAAKSQQTGQKPTLELAIGLGQVLAGRPELATAYDEELAQNQQAAEVARQWFLAKDEESAFDHSVKLLLQADAIAIKRSCLAFAAAAVAVHG